MNDLFAISLLYLGALQIALGLSLAVSLWFFLQFRPNTNAVTRYRLWCIAFFATALLPLLTVLPEPSKPEAKPQELTQAVTQPLAVTSIPTPADVVSKNTPPILANQSIPMLARVFVLFWLVLLLWRGYRFVGGLRSIKSYELKQRLLDSHLTQWVGTKAGQFNITHPVKVYQVPGLMSPMTVGFKRPWIAIPDGLTQRVEPTVIHHALLHELAHIKRKDSWVSLLQRFFEILWAFNPALLWMSFRMNLEREKTCDDWAITFGRDAKTYASSLLDILEARGRRSVNPFAVACIKNKSDLSRRIINMLDKKMDHSIASQKLATLAAATIAFVGLAFTATALPEFGPMFSPTESQYENTLYSAAYDGDLEQARNFIDQGANVNTIYKKNSPRTALNAAAIKGHKEMVELLLNHGADFARVVRGDAPALTAAARHGHVEIVRLLLERGAKAEQPVRGDGSAIILGAATGELEILQLLLQSGADVNSRVRGDGTPLISAARRGHVEIVRFLLENGADPNLGSPGDETPMHHAANNGNLAIVSLLLNAGADANKTSRGDGSPLMLAIESGNQALVDRLIQAGAGVDESVIGDGSPLITAVRESDEIAVRNLLNAGADVNKGVRGDGNPLIAAAIGGDLAIAKLLLQSGANVNGKIKGDDTVLINAVRSNNSELVRLLLESGADANLAGDYDRKIGRVRTPLNQARTPEVVALLTAAGAGG